VDDITYSLEKAVLGLTLYTDGRFTFNAGHEHYQSLEKDEILNIIVNYKATDSQDSESETNSFTITVIGTNDTPVATYTTNIDVEEDSTINGQLTATDIDNRETLTYSLVRAIAGLTLYTDGRFTFNASDPNYQSLAQGSGQNIIVNYKVTDSQGAQDTEFFTIIVTGTNDKPVATYITNINVDEDSIITGHLTATDVDGDDITYSLVNEVSGLTLYADGSFTFNASNQH
jgi:VCBS repeat-containing protein